MKFFDSHCHLQFEAFDDVREEIVNEMIKNGSRTINVGSSIENSESGVLLAEKHPDTLISSVGVHPFHSLGFEIYKDKEEAHSMVIKYPQDLNKLKELAKNISVKAIGECGIDFSYFKDLEGGSVEKEEWKQKQIECFRFQIKLAKELNLPLILHIRKEYILSLNILKEEAFQGKAVFHFFKGKIEDFKEIIQNTNYFFGFSGVITYDEYMDEIIREIPLDRIMIETDAPYVAPIPFRGELNRPEYVIKVAEKIALVKEISLEEILDISYKNAVRFFEI